MIKKLSLFLFAALLFIISCTPIEKQCTTDNECVPAVCCHATDALNEQYAPSCNGVLCTMECKPGTIDCGQGQIKCIENKCTVVLKD